MPQGCVWFIHSLFEVFCGHTEILYAFLFVEDTLISTKDLQLNENIRVPEVRLVGVDGEQLGILKTEAALHNAEEHNVDLVMIAPTAQPPVCRAMDYGKYRFERLKKEKEAKKKQQIVKIKEVQLSCRIDTHDFDTRVKAACRFLQEGNKVRVVIRFKGREMSHMDIGRTVIEQFRTACAEFGTADKPAAVEGRNMSITLSPVKAAK